MYVNCSQSWQLLIILLNYQLAGRCYFTTICYIISILIMSKLGQSWTYGSIASNEPDFSTPGYISHNKRFKMTFVFSTRAQNHGVGISLKPILKPFFWAWCARDNETNKFSTWSGRVRSGNVVGGAASYIKGIFESQYLRIRKHIKIQK